MTIFGFDESFDPNRNYDIPITPDPLILETKGKEVLNLSDILTEFEYSESFPCHTSLNWENGFAHHEESKFPRLDSTTYSNRTSSTSISKDEMKRMSLSYVDEEVKQVMNRDKINSSSNYERDIVKSLLANLHEEAEYRRKEIEFLRAECNYKNNTINDLLGKMSGLLVKNNDGDRHYNSIHSTEAVDKPPQVALNEGNEDSGDRSTTDDNVNVNCVKNDGPHVTNDDHVGKNDQNQLNALICYYLLFGASLLNELIMVEQKIESDNDEEELGAWQAHTKGFASKYMKKYGYSGKGIGPHENGIIKPVKAVSKKQFDQAVTQSPTEKDEQSDQTSPPHTPSEEGRAWPKGTVLVIGDSMIGGINGRRMSRQRKVVVSSHGGATVRDMKDHLNALLRRKPDHLIIHAHSNDAGNKNVSADMLYDRLLDVKRHAENVVPGISVTISTPILRQDDPRANAKHSQLNNRLKQSGLSIIVNDNITNEHIGKGKGKGLHLNGHGTGKLAVNMITFIKDL